MDAAPPGTGAATHQQEEGPLDLGPAVLTLPRPGAEPQPRALTEQMCLPLLPSDPEPQVQSGPSSQEHRTTPRQQNYRPHKP